VSPYLDIIIANNNTAALGGILLNFLYFIIINNRFNLLFDLVPLMGLYRQIPIEKTSLFIEKKPIFK